MRFRFAALARLTYAIVFAALVALAHSSLARGHAVLLATDPPERETLAFPPSRITLTFSENVSLALGGVDVYAPDGHTINSGRAEVAGNQVAVPIDAHEQGTHAVSWRVLSADGHPVSGAFVFTIGRASEESVSAEIARESAATSRALSIAFGTSRAAYILGILFATGGAFFAAFVVPGWRPRLLRAVLAVVFASIVAAFFLEAAIAAGTGLAATFDWGVIRRQADTVYGNGTLVRLALAVAALFASLVFLRPARLWERVAAATTFACLAVSLSITGHALSTDPTWGRLPLDMLHVLLAAMWFGGLFQLWRYVHTREVAFGVRRYAHGHELQHAAVARYSQLAFLSVVGLVATGSYFALAESGYSLGALIGTTYGWLLTGKLAAFAATIPLAYVNRFRNVPQLAADPELSSRTLSRYVRAEIVLLLAVVGMTAWLIQAQPARHTQHRAAAAPEAIDETRRLASGADVRLLLRPAAAGPNSVTVSVRTRDGAPDATVDEISLRASSSERGIAPLSIELREAGAGRWQAASAVLPLAGSWRFEIAIRRGDFDEESTHIDAEITER